MRGNVALQGANSGRRGDAAEQPPDNGPDADIDFEDMQDLAAVLTFFQEGDVIDADHLAALGVDDLLIEQVANHAQHVFVGMIRSEALVFEVNTAGTDGLDLVISDAQPGGACAYEKAVKADGVNKRDERCIAECSNAAAFQVVHFDAQEFRKVEDLFRHTYRSSAAG